MQVFESRMVVVKRSGKKLEARKVSILGQRIINHLGINPSCILHINSFIHLILRSIDTHAYQHTCQHRRGEKILKLYYILLQHRWLLGYRMAGMTPSPER